MPPGNDLVAFRRAAEVTAHIRCIGHESDDLNVDVPHLGIVVRTPLRAVQALMKRCDEIATPLREEIQRLRDERTLLRMQLAESHRREQEDL